MRKPFPNGHKEETHFFFDPLIAQLLKCSEFLSVGAPPCPFFSNNKEGIEKKANIVSMCTQIPATFIKVQIRTT